MSAAQLDHVGLTVGDLDAQIEWYGTALDLRVTNVFHIEQLKMRAAFMVNDDGLVLELLERAGSSAGLQASSPAEALLTRGYGHICLRVHDADAFHARLLAAGAEERMAPQAAPEPGVRMSFVADPEGNLLELLDRKGPIRP
ncbi:VOC family protein [Pseudarthrobacter oxydans]|uniref:VOC family protein n=1 Tax=Pseudarthrobacter oxydans TaxID=1671 RepID=UPI003807FE01